MSRRIYQLEQDLQLRLLNRDAHKVSLTHTGELYFLRYSELFDELNDIGEDLHSEKHQPKGKIRVCAPINAGSQFLKDIFYDFLVLYPDIQLDLRFSNTLVDIEGEGIDVVFRVGVPVVDHWIARKLVDIRFMVCSSPSSQIPTLLHPTELCGKPLILCHPMSVWNLVNINTGQAYDYHPNKNIRMEVDEIQLLTHGVKKGVGIGYIPDYFALPLIESGELCHVLPEWRSQARRLSMLYRDRDNLPLRVRLFIEFVLARFR